MVWPFRHESEAREIENISDRQIKMEKAQKECDRQHARDKQAHKHDESVHEHDVALLQKQQRDLDKLKLEKIAWKQRAEELEHANSLLKAHCHRKSASLASEREKRVREGLQRKRRGREKLQRERRGREKLERGGWEQQEAQIDRVEQELEASARNVESLISPKPT